MNRIPKWLLMKEWLSSEDVGKLLEAAPSALEHVLAQDLSEEFGYSFRFICTFCPRQCKKEYKEYRFENLARSSMRSHLRDHILALKKSTSTDDTEDFLTRNNMFKGSNKAPKHKLPTQSTPSTKKAKLSRNVQEKIPLETCAVDQSNVMAEKPRKAKPKVKQFTKLKACSPEHQSENELSDQPCSRERPPHNDFVSEEMIESIKRELNEVNRDLEEAGHETDDTDEQEDNGSERADTETQTESGGKEQETLQYRIATKLFATDRSLWINVEQVLSDIIEREQSKYEVLLPEDRGKILEGMSRWIESVQIYDHQTISRMHDPLTAAERNTLDSLSLEDWKKLDSAQDPESKLRLTVYARLLLRDYECYPRKLKPKVCKHCNRQYTASTSLYSHLVSLSGIRFWVCSKCKDANKEEATFTRKHSLQYHIMKEVGIPRYRCTQPGCSKTHNHTHHQKSHARQHTGEKHYVCEIAGCNSKFSNRNTYSRHLLQYHNVELTRSNELHEIDEKEAKLKVYAARLKARERSKSKRQQEIDNSLLIRIAGTRKSDSSTEYQIRINPPTELPESSSAASTTSTESDQSKSALSLEKLMRPSASQLLCGIARDVRNTTTSIDKTKCNNNDSMMGGLNLLATVSKYMNAESCSKDLIPELDCTNLMDSSTSQSSGMSSIQNSNNLSTIPRSQPLTVGENVPHTLNDLPKQTNSCFPKEQVSLLKKRDVGSHSVAATHGSLVSLSNTLSHGSSTPHLEASSENNQNASLSTMKVLTVGNLKLAPFTASSGPSDKSKLLRVIQAPNIQVLKQPPNYANGNVSTTTTSTAKNTIMSSLCQMGQDNKVDKSNNIASAFLQSLDKVHLKPDVAKTRQVAHPVVSHSNVRIVQWNNSLVSGTIDAKCLPQAGHIKASNNLATVTVPVGPLQVYKIASPSAPLSNGNNLPAESFITVLSHKTDQSKNVSVNLNQSEPERDMSTILPFYDKKTKGP